MMTTRRASAARITNHEMATMKSECPAAAQAFAAFQAAGLRGLLTQGIGLRPQMPWAKYVPP